MKTIIAAVLVCNSLLVVQNATAQITSIWNVATGPRVNNAPAVGLNGTLYLGSGTSLSAVGQQGNLLWAKQLSAQPSAPSISPDGNVLVGTAAGKVFAISTNGAEKWQFSMGRAIYTTPAIGPDGTVYVTSGGYSQIEQTVSNLLVALTPALSPSTNPTVKFQIPFNPYAHMSCPAIGQDGTVYVGVDSFVYAINTNGTTKWTFNAGTTIYDALALGTNGDIYVATDEAKLFAVSTNGNQRWVAQMSRGAIVSDGDNTSSPPVVAGDGSIVLASSGGHLYVFSSTGVLQRDLILNPIIGTTTFGFPLRVAPTVTKDGDIFLTTDTYLIKMSGNTTSTVLANNGMGNGASITLGMNGNGYYVSADGMLHAISLNKLPLDTSWSTFQGNFQQTGYRPVASAIITNSEITFDDIAADPFGVTIGSTYRNLSWSNFACVDGVHYVGLSGYGAGVITPNNVAFNGGGNPASISNTIPFNLVSGYVTAAWTDNLKLRAVGYIGASLAFDQTNVLSATTPQFVNWNYRGVTRVDFISFGGDLVHSGYSGSGTHFALDNLTITPTNTANTCTPAPAGLIGWWKCNGDGLDAGGFHNGNLQNGVTTGAGVAGQALVFNGTDAAVAISNAPTPQRLSVEAWVRFDSLDSSTVSAGLQNIIFRKNSREFNFEGFSISKFRDVGGDRIGWEITSAEGYNSKVSSTNLVATGRYYHVVGTFDGTNMNLFIDGNLHGSAYHPYPIDYGSRPMFFGSTGESWNGFFAGALDEVSLYGRALTAQEVADLYAAAAAGKCPSAILPLASGVELRNCADQLAGQRFFQIDVPPGMASLSISTWGGIGDCDLYVRFGAAPTPSIYDYRPYTGSNNETVFVNNPAPGTWYVMLNGFSSYSGLNIVANYGSVTATQPTLAAALTNQNLLLSWPASAASYQLETSTNVSLLNSWQSVSGSFTDDGYVRSTTVSSNSLQPRQFFRLHLP